MIHSMKDRISETLCDSWYNKEIISESDVKCILYKMLSEVAESHLTVYTETKLQENKIADIAIRNSLENIYEWVIEIKLFKSRPDFEKIKYDYNKMGKNQTGNFATIKNRCVIAIYYDEDDTYVQKRMGNRVNSHSSDTVWISVNLYNDRRRDDFLKIKEQIWPKKVSR